MWYFEWSLEASDEKTLIRVMVAGFLAVGLCVAAGAQTQVPKKSKVPAALKKDAKITIEEARAAALKKVPGEIQEEELERKTASSSILSTFARLARKTSPKCR